MRETNTQKNSDKAAKHKDRGAKPKRKTPKGKDKARKGKDKAPKAEGESAEAGDRAARRERRRARKTSLEHRKVTSRDEAVTYLETLLGAVRSGSVQFERDAEVMTLEVPEQLRVGVKASRSDKTEQLTLSLRWRRGIDAPLLVKHG